MIWQHQKRMSVFLSNLPFRNNNYSLASCSNLAFKAYLFLDWMGRFCHNILVDYSKRISEGCESTATGFPVCCDSSSSTDSTQSVNMRQVLTNINKKYCFQRWYSIDIFLSSTTNIYKNCYGIIIFRVAGLYSYLTFQKKNKRVHNIKIKTYNFKEKCYKSISKYNQLELATGNPYQVNLPFLDLPMATTPI